MLTIRTKRKHEETDFYIIHRPSSGMPLSVPCNAKGKAKHVVFIGLDGWGSYSVPKADIPHIKQLMADGSYTLEKRTVLPLLQRRQLGKHVYGGRS